MNDVRYEIVGTEIKPYTFRTPVAIVNENGDANVTYPNDDVIYIKQITFLNLVGRDKNRNIVSYEPMDYVNVFLMSHHIDDGKEESAQYSKGLIHYFSFLITLQDVWDNKYDEELFDELVDLSRPRWDFIASRKAQRITYLYRNALKNSVLNELDPNLRLARTTATAYMNAVIKFYSFHIRQGYEFNNPPFDHEVVVVNFQTSSSSMKAYMSRAVHTTDLRLNFPKSKRNEGGSLPEARKDLRPLASQQWKCVENILLNTKVVLKNVKGQKKSVRLAEEYCLFFLVARYTGLRKEEIASLHCGQIFKPNINRTMLQLGVGDRYGSLTKSKSGANKSRETLIPSAVMQLLYEYTCSIRYHFRLEKYKALCHKKREQGEDAFFESIDGVDETKNYLFISNSGLPFFLKLTELNSRWSEVRDTVKTVSGRTIQGTIHNLRATFAVAIFRALLKKTTPDAAVAFVSSLLGHENISTTLLYLKIAQNDSTGDEIYEDVLDYLGIFNESEMLTDNLTINGNWHYDR